MFRVLTEGGDAIAACSVNGPERDGLQCPSQNWKPSYAHLQQPHLFSIIGEQLFG